MITRLPGADLVEQGLADLKADIESEAALLVLIGAPRLRRLGWAVQEGKPDPELRLYEYLRRQNPDSAHTPVTTP